MDIELTLTRLIAVRAILIWLPALIIAITIVRRRNESRRLRLLSAWMGIGLLLEIAFFALAFIMSNPGQGAEES